MRARVVFALVASILAAAAASLPAQEPATTQVVLTPAADLKWMDLDPKGAPGVQIVDLWGDHTKGAFGAYLKLPAGFTVPMHWHTHAMRAVFLSGTYLQTPEGKPEVRLGPGSYMMQPGAGYNHITRCDQGAECVLFFESEGPFDLHVLEGTQPAGGGAEAQMGAWMGSWKLNEARSKMGAGTTKNPTVTYTTAGDNLVVTVDGVTAEGKPVHHVWTGKLDGKDYPVSGDPTSDTRSYRKIDDRTLEFVGKRGGKVTVTGRVSHSQDGQVRTVTTTVTDARGKKIKSTAIYDKVP
jgi:hypothetical protein